MEVTSEANAVWLGVDVTYNTEILLINSDAPFIACFGGRARQ